MVMPVNELPPPPPLWTGPLVADIEKLLENKLTDDQFCKLQILIAQHAISALKT